LYSTISAALRNPKQTSTMLSEYIGQWKESVVRFLIGLIGGALAGAIIIGVSFVVDSHGAGRALAAISALAVDHQSPLIGLIILSAFAAVLGAAFTSGMCGRIATGPAIMVGMVYGIFLWAFVALLIPTVTDPGLFPVRSRAIAGTSIGFGTLMGVWVIISAHIWPSMMNRCELPPELRDTTDEE
jgi:hypothetical protein